MAVNSFDQNTRYSKYKDKQSITQTLGPSASRKAPTTLDIRSRSYQNKKSLFSKLSANGTLDTTAPLLNGVPISRNIETKKDDDIFS